MEGKKDRKLLAHVRWTQINKDHMTRLGNGRPQHGIDILLDFYISNIELVNAWAAENKKGNNSK